MNQSLFTDEARRLFVGHPFSINYDEAHLLTSDEWKLKASGLPKGCFLLAFYDPPGSSDGTGQSDSEALLLRALGPIKLPNNDNNIASMIEYYKERNYNESAKDPVTTKQHIDPYTRFEFSFSGLACRVLGSFYRTNGKIEFGADIENFFAPNNYRVYKASGEILKAIVNQHDESIENDQSEFKIGTVRYSSTKRLSDNGQTDKKVPVSVSANNFLGKRTALFGMTRTGKSNTVKKIIQATSDISLKAKSGLDANQELLESPLTKDGLPLLQVGQIIFDINGEYANENLQDDGTAIYKMYEDSTVRYSCIKKPGFKEMKINFYREVEAGFEAICETLAEDGSDYTKSLMTIDLKPPSGSDFSKKTIHDRLTAAYHCCLYRAGFQPPNEMSTVEFTGNQEINERIGADPKMGIGFDKAIEWFEACWQNDHSSLNGEEDLRAMLVFLTRKSKPKAAPTLSGYIKLRDSDLKNSHTADGGDKSFTDQIDDWLRAGKIVIVDLSEGVPSIQQNFSEKICRRVFNSSIANFTNRKNNNFIQFYFEEAHNLFPQAENKNLSQIYNRLAKEGAKLNIGLIYATQEVSSLSKNILKNTQNWFIAHLNNRDEIKELQKYYDFEDFTDSLIRFSANNDKGFVRMKTYTNPFVVPIQIDRFFVPKKNTPNPVEDVIAQTTKQPENKKGFARHGLFKPAQ